MKIYLVHVYDGAGKLWDYYPCLTLDGALTAAIDAVVAGRFADAEASFREVERRRVLDAIYEDVGRWHARCDAWLAHVDEMEARP